MKDNIIKIMLKIDYLPPFGTWKWSKGSYKKPLIFAFDNVEVKMLLEDPNEIFEPEEREELEMPMSANLEMVFKDAKPNFIRGLRTSGAYSIKAAQRIYKIYREVLSQFEVLCRTTARMKFFFSTPPASIKNFFYSTLSSFGSSIKWYLNTDGPYYFNPKLPVQRGINPIFGHEQLITKRKWKLMQEAIDQRNFPEEEILEILRIRSNFLLGQRKIATLEISILLESIIGNYASNLLINRGFGRNKVKKLRKKMTFYQLLNIVLPLSIDKDKLRTQRMNISNIDTLRDIRNKIIHGEIKEKDIEKSIVLNGIESGLKLVQFLKSK